MFVVGDRPVTGENFIGREAEISELICGINNSNNIAISGLPRIGKTSLVREAIRRLGCQKEQSPFFLEYTLTRKAEDSGKLYQTLNRFLAPMITGGLESITDTSYLTYKEIYEEIYEQTKKDLYIVIDEMDYAHESLRSEIQNLRELGQSDHIHLITISRHSLISIFPLGSDGSNFPGIFSLKITLKGYNEGDVALFEQTLRSQLQMSRPIKQDVWEPLWKQVRYYCGNIPFLLSIFASGLLKEADALPSVVLENYIIKDSAYDSCLHYWFQSLCERKLMREVRSFIDSKGESAVSGDLTNMGILDGKRFTIPYLREYILQNSRADNRDLIQNYNLLWKENASILLERARGFSIEIQGLDAAASRELRKGARELEAFNAKTQYITALSELRSELIEPDISQEELNLFKEFIQRFSNKIESLAR